MALIAMLSAKGSPGVTTTGLACTLSWFRRTILAECDPAGGDVLAGYLGALEIPQIGLLPLAVADLRGQLASEFATQLIDLDPEHPGHRLLLPGLTDPVQAASVTGSWARLADFLGSLEQAEPAYDVIADCGRLTTSIPPLPLLHRADLVVLVLRATSLRTVSPAVPAIHRLKQELTASGQGTRSLAAVVVGATEYPAREVQRQLHVPVLGELPIDTRAAKVLSDGGRLRGKEPLLRAAVSLEAPARRLIAARRASLMNTVEAPHG